MVMSPIVKELLGTVLRKQIIGVFVVVTVWAVVGTFVPHDWLGGWLGGGINIVFLLLSLAGGAVLQRTLSLLLPSWLAWSVAIVITVAMFGIVRPLEQDLLAVALGR